MENSVFDKKPSNIEELREVVEQAASSTAVRAAVAAFALTRTAVVLSLSSSLDIFAVFIINFHICKRFLRMNILINLVCERYSAVLK